MKDGIEVEINLTTTKEKTIEEGERRKDKYREQPSSSDSQEARMDVLMKIVENLMERLAMDNRPPPKGNQEQ